MMLEWVFAVIVLTYCLLILYLWLGWEHIEMPLPDDKEFSVTVIIPVRNEADTIQRLLTDLQKQTYTGQWEVIVVNDHSEDDTAAIVLRVIKSNNRFKLLELDQNEGKKSALAYGISSTSSDIILTTDGDCQMGPEWIAAMIKAMQGNIQLVSGPVGFVNRSGIFHHMQVIEFASLIGSGAAMVGWGKPIMANGANLAFRRSAFEEVEGYDGDGTIASGDDVFLLHKIAARFPDSIAFAKDAEAVVHTGSQPDLKSFWSQRKRWASKWKAYTDTRTRLVAVLVFLMAFSFAVMPILAAFNTINIFVWINLWVAKSFFDYFFLRQVVRFSRSPMNLIAFILLEIIYPIYVVTTALFSMGKTYTWKGRKVQ